MISLWPFTYGITTGMVLFLLVGHLESIHTSTHVSIIERGYGLYCPKDGNFAFVGECTDE